MNNLEVNLELTFSKLQERLYQAKTIHLRYVMIEKHKLFLLRQAVLSIYSAWEGFLKEALLLYLQELNKLNLSYDQLSDEYLAFQTDHICLFQQSNKSHKTVKEISRNLLETYTQTVNFNTKINVTSNANLKITNAILTQLALGTLPSVYGKELNKLLFFRNSVAHGDADGLKIEQKDIDDFTLLVQNLASDTIVSVVEGYDNQVYLKHTA